MGRKLKIAMVGHKRVPSREGGIEIVVEELSTRMVAKGHNVTLYNRGGHHVSGKEFDSQKFTEYNGVKLKSVLTIDKKGFAAVSSSFFGALKAAFGKYDVVHFHAEGTCVFMWIPKMMRKRCVTTVHGLDWQREKWRGGFGSKFIHYGEKQAVKHADEIIVLSEGVQKYFRKEYGRKTVLIPNGVNKPEVVEADEIKQRWGLEKDGYILFLGRIVPEKGIKYLVEAYKRVKTDKKLVIAGGASDTDKFLQELKTMVGDNVIFTGFVSGRTLDELYSNAYIYCLPSDLEGMPLSLLEAMSYGNCCVVSDIDECASVIEDKAIVMKKGNVSDLREKLQLLCGDRGLVEKYKSEAAEFIVRKYSWDDVVERTIEEVYVG